MAYEQYDQYNDNPYDQRVDPPQTPFLAPQPNPPKPPPNPFNYEQARDAWMSGRYSRDEAGIRQWNDEFGALKNYQGGDVGDLINGGGMIDLLGNFKSGQNVSANWTPAGGNGPNPNGMPAGGPAPVPGTIPGVTPAAPAMSAKQQELYDMLMARAKQGTAIDRNDPNIRQQVDPYAAQMERASRNYIADQAERQGPLANIRGEQRLASERSGQASGLFESQLIGRELENRRQEITHALDSMRGMLSEEQELALRKELALINDATQRYGIQTGANTAAQQLGLGYSELDWQMDPRNPRNWDI